MVEHVVVEFALVVAVDLEEAQAHAHDQLVAVFFAAPDPMLPNLSSGESHPDRRRRHAASVRYHRHLFEDSANGTPVAFNKTFQLSRDKYDYPDDGGEPKVTESRYATVKVDVSVVNGKLEATTRLESNNRSGVG